MKIKLNKMQWEQIGKTAGWIKVAERQLQLTPAIAEEIAIDFEYYEDHYDDPNSAEAMLEKGIYEKLINGNFSFNSQELILIGQTLISIADKDMFFEDKKLQKQLFDVQLQLGMWKPITDEYAKEAVRNGLGVKMKHFPKVNGIRYESNDQWENSLV